jgi:WhiB family redox-sensing transcriptional regulator
MDKPGVNQPTARAHWRQSAVCLPADPELFFPVSDTGPGLRQADQAKAICARCPVRRECLVFAIGTGQQYGIWGGLTEDDRRPAAARQSGPHRNGHAATTHAIMQIQAEFARTASQRRTEADLRMLRHSVSRASGLNGAWEDRAAAHAEFHCLLADATGASAYALLARLISGGVREMIAWAGPSAGDLITAAHRRLTRHLETHDADGTAREMERYLALLGQAQGEPAAVGK